MASRRLDPDRVTPLLRLRIRNVFKHVPKALVGGEEPIHQMRVAGRRLRVALPLLARKSAGRRVRRALGILREMTRAAGASRDLDVGADMFEERCQTAPGPSPERAILRRRLRAARRRSRVRMAEALLDLEIARLRRDLRVIVGRKGEDIFTVALRLRQMRESEGAALLGGFESLGDAFDPTALHRLRRQARRLRYAAEVADALRGEDSDAPALFKRLQEQIGAIHDRHVLASWLEAQARSSWARGQEAVASQAEQEQGVFLAEAREHHRRLLERNPVAVASEALAVMARSRSAA